MHCSFCPETTREKAFMSVEQFEHIAKQIAPYTDYVYLHVKGEPLLHPNLDEILKICKKYKFKVNISTNGVLLDKTWKLLENIRQINAEHRQIDKATDVLSFPMFERNEIDSLKKEDEMEDILGDIIVSVEKVREQAEEYGHSFERELAYLVTHGMLHLLGYDHMIEEEKVVMRKREEEILGVLDITRD